MSQPGGWTYWSSGPSHVFPPECWLALPLSHISTSSSLKQHAKLPQHVAEPTALTESTWMRAWHDLAKRMQGTATAQLKSNQDKGALPVCCLTACFAPNSRMREWESGTLLFLSAWKGKLLSPSSLLSLRKPPIAPHQPVLTVALSFSLLCRAEAGPAGSPQARSEPLGMHRLRVPSRSHSLVISKAGNFRPCTECVILLCKWEAASAVSRGAVMLGLRAALCAGSSPVLQQVS